MYGQGRKGLKIDAKIFLLTLGAFAAMQGYSDLKLLGRVNQLDRDPEIVELRNNGWKVMILPNDFTGIVRTASALRIMSEQTEKCLSEEGTLETRVKTEIVRSIIDGKIDILAFRCRRKENQ
jgi:hypothetical protein